MKENHVFVRRTGVKRALTISRNIRTGQRLAASKGRHLGRPPFGYRKEKGRNVAVLSEASTVLTLHVLFVWSVSMFPRATYEELGEVFGASAKKVQRLLQNHHYTGVFQWGGALTSYGFTVVPPELFEETTNLLKSKSNGYIKGKTARATRLRALKEQYHIVHEQTIGWFTTDAHKNADVFAFFRLPKPRCM